ncbi:MAG TPA: type VI secretion system baseplate subunit TssF [Burkholderiaceae bacterium]|nr:type VI secretion system baseplate subunit TssF [Burkholderiaceae bacterium]
MNPRLLDLYNQELGHVREMGAEFARQFPKIASRLSLDGVEVADPYVERLLEGFAFMAARVQLKIEAEFPRFVQHLTEVTCPTLAAPLPSMAVVRLHPDPAEPKLAGGVAVARGSGLRSTHARGAETRCQFRTAHDVTLWPLEIAAVQYFSFAPDLPLTQLPHAARVRGGLRIRLRAFDGIKLKETALDKLTFYLSGPDESAFRLYELVFGSLLGTLVLPAERPAPWFEAAGPNGVRAVGFDDAEALLPPARAGFRGYRLLQEYAALPQRYLFFEVGGLAEAVRRVARNEFEIVLLFERGDAALEALIDSGSLALHCTPAINLLPKRLDRVQVSEGTWEFHVVADRTRPIDYEVYRIEQVTAYGGAAFGEQRFLPLYTTFHDAPPEAQAFFTVRREPRLVSPAARQEGPRSSYRGSEVYIALVDPAEAPFREDIRQLAIEALVTNRDLPLLLPGGGADAPGRNDFQLDSGAPVARVQLVRGPSRPRPAREDGVSTWDLISHLNLNYLSLVDTDEREGAALLRSILRLHAGDDAGMRKQIEGVRSVDARQVVRRLPHPGPLTFGAGVEIRVTGDELAFQGGSLFLLGAVLERLFARYAGINSFTETAVHSLTRGEIKRWPPRAGTRPVL